ncbi:MAG: flagellar hook-length control protein FliK [Alphaproteobacteria bacterium]|nr:flagellar hook-length control protein FliK [Alphaproteobacteria bacterium]
MNPVDQLMQSVGSSPSSGVMGLMGLAKASEGNQAAMPGLFADTLSTVSTSQETEALAGGELIATGILSAEFTNSADFARWGASVPSELDGAINLRAFLGLPNDTPASGILAQLGQEHVGPDGQKTASFAAMPDVLSNISLQGLTTAGSTQHPAVPLVFSGRLEELGLKLEQLPALPTGEEMAAIFGKGKAGTLHGLPTNVIEQALAQREVASQGAVPNTQAQSPVPAQTMESVQPAFSGLEKQTNPMDLLVPSGASEENAQTVLQSTTKAPNIAELPNATVESASEKLIVGNGIASEQVVATLQESAVSDPRSQETEPQVLTAAQQVAGQKTAQAATANKPGVTTNANARPSSPSAINQAANTGSANTPKSENASELGSAKPIEAVAARADAMPPAQPTREPAPALTPERLSGLFDNTAASSVAAGLSGMRGESSFLSSMSLMGGRATPEFAQHVGQQLNMHVSKAIKAGQQEFTVRLDPAELGRVQVKLAFEKDGSIQTRVIVERPETLELLQKDAKGLERAISSAGHKTDGGIQFSLDTNDEQSAGRAFAEAVQQEKMRDDLAARSGIPGSGNGSTDTAPEDDIVPLEEILANVNTETGLDISV